MMRRFWLVIVFLTAAALPAAAQLGRQIAVQAGTPEDKALIAITQATNPKQKLALLNKFAAEHPSGDMAVMADQLYVSVYLSLKKYSKVYQYGEKALAIDPGDFEVAVELVRAAQLQNDTAKIFTYGLKAGQMVARYKAQPPLANFPAEEWAAQKQQTLSSLRPSIEWVAGVLYQATRSAGTPARRASYLNSFMNAFRDSSYAQNAEYRIAEAYRRSGETEKMLAFLRKRVAANPNDVGMQLLLADYLSTKGIDLVQAETSAKKVLDILSTETKPAGMTDAQWRKQWNGQKGLAYSALGQVYVQKKNDADAVKAYEQARPLLKDRPLNNARNLYRLGFTLAKMKRYAQARAALEGAAKADTPYRAMSEKILRRLPRSHTHRR